MYIRKEISCTRRHQVMWCSYNDNQTDEWQSSAQRDAILTPESESSCWSQYIYHTRLWVLFCFLSTMFFFTCFAEYLLVKQALKWNTNVFDGSSCLFSVKKTLCLESTETLSLDSFLIGGFLSNNCFQSCIFSLRGWHE